MLNSYAHKFSQRSVSEFIIRRFQREREKRKKIYSVDTSKSLWQSQFPCENLCERQFSSVWFSMFMARSASVSNANFVGICYGTDFKVHHVSIPLRCIFEYKSMAVCYPIDLDFFDYDVHFIFIWLRSVRIGRTELSKKIAHICE